MRRLMAILIFLVFVSFPFMVFAEETNVNAVSFKWGYSTPPIYFTGPDGEDFHLRGPLYELSYTRMFDKIGVEIGVSNTSSSNNESYTFDNGIWADPEIELTSWRIPLTVKYINNVEKFNLYGGLGIGFYSSKLKTTNTSNLSDYNFSGSLTSSGIDYHVLVGGSYTVTNKVALGLDFKLNWCRYDFGSNAFFTFQEKTTRELTPYLYAKYLF